jgi:hypothetical protein
MASISNSKKLLIVIMSVLIIMIVGTIVMTYFIRVDSPFIMTIRKTFYLPAIIVDGHNITIAELDENTKSIRHFYEAQDFSRLGIRIDFNTEDGKKRLKLEEEKMINKLIEDIAIEELAAEWDIKVSDEAVEMAMDRPIAEVGSSDEVEKKLENLYGWTLEEFGEKVVKKQLLKEKVSEKFKQNNLVTEEMRQKINNAKRELNDNRTFSDVAIKYSEGTTAKDGGIIGWFMDGQVQDEIGKQIFTMEKGEYTDIIETPLGLHIAHIDEVTEVDGKKMVHISQIVVHKQTFAEYINEKIKKMNVKVFIPEYEWDKDKAIIVFLDQTMREFKDEIAKETLEVQEN